VKKAKMNISLYKVEYSKKCHKYKMQKLLMFDYFSKGVEII
jgi:hypothetical protein